MPGGSIQINADGSYASGDLKGFIRHHISLLRGIKPDGGLNMMLTADDGPVSFMLDARGKADMVISVLDDKHGTVCRVPQPPQLKAHKLSELYFPLLDVEGELMCEKRGDSNKTTPLTYRVQQRTIRVVDQLYDLNKNNLETVRYSTTQAHMDWTGNFTYDATAPDDSAIYVYITRGTLGGLAAENRDGTIQYRCLVPGKTPRPDF